ncbi:hypothetical protein ACFL4T_07440 [candidate division KSB1 bacterium]
MKTLRMFLTIIFLFTVFCSSNSTGIEDNSGELLIKIVDEDNNPVPDVDFHYIYDLGYIQNTANIGFPVSISETDTGSLTLTAPLSNEKITIFEDRAFHAGNHIFFINHSTYKLTNGIYHMNLALKRNDHEQDIPILYNNIDSLITYNPLIRSDMNGQIVLPYDIFHFGENFGSDQMQLTVSDSIIVILYNPDFEVFRKSVIPKSDEKVILNCVLKQ